MWEFQFVTLRYLYLALEVLGFSNTDLVTLLAAGCVGHDLLSTFPQGSEDDTHNVAGCTPGALLEHTVLLCLYYFLIMF